MYSVKEANKIIKFVKNPNYKSINSSSILFIKEIKKQEAPKNSLQ
jgi:hypothetical protein